jgi:flagellar protein FlbT
MPPDQADTPARRIYFALQSAYIGDETEREVALDAARHFINEFQEATTSNMVRTILSQALVAAEEDDCYQALKLVRRIIRHETTVTGHPTAKHPEGIQDEHV